MILVRTIQGDRIPINEATEKDIKFGAESRMAKINGYLFNWDQLVYIRVIEEEEGKE